MKKVQIKLSIVVLAICFFSGCKPNDSKDIEVASNEVTPEIVLDLAAANNLAEMPLACMNQEFPNKLSQTLGSKSDLKTPNELHPAFYGCFDWHSAVHGHWSLVSLLVQFPNLNKSEIILNQLKSNISKENIEQEIIYFENKNEKSFERMYGWAWLLKLAQELHNWDHPDARLLEENLQPLTDLIVEKYIEFIPKLNYPIRVGTHTNTAFGFSLAYDYAKTMNMDRLSIMIEQKAKEFYLNDSDCPITWEPSGYDFFSPCLEELDLMRRVLNKEEFKIYIDKFLPQIAKKDYYLAPGEVSDREDGHLVHLDGLNFSRAWCLYALANEYPEYGHLKSIADEHMQKSYESVVGDSYEGGHWLASFLIYALQSKSATNF